MLLIFVSIKNSQIYIIMVEFLWLWIYGKNEPILEAKSSRDKTLLD